MPAAALVRGRLRTEGLQGWHSCLHRDIWWTKVGFQCSVDTNA